MKILPVNQQHVSSINKQGKQTRQENISFGTKLVIDPSVKTVPLINQNKLMRVLNAFKKELAHCYPRHGILTVSRFKPSERYLGTGYTDDEIREKLNPFLHEENLTLTLDASMYVTRPQASGWYSYYCPSDRHLSHSENIAYCGFKFNDFDTDKQVLDDLMRSFTSIRCNAPLGYPNE